MTDPPPGSVVAGAPPASGHCLAISPESRNHLQTIVNNIEVLARAIYDLGVRRRWSTVTTINEGRLSAKKAT